MKKMFFVGKMLLSAACAVGLACIAIMNDWRDSAVIAVFLFGGIMIALFLGAFNISDIPTHWSIKQGARSMRHAA